MDLIRRLEQEQISGKWPYAVQAESPALEALPMEAQKAELKRLLMRQTGQKLSKDEKEEQAEESPEEACGLGPGDGTGSEKSGSLPTRRRTAYRFLGDEPLASGM